MPAAATVDPVLTWAPGVVPSVAQPAVEITRIMRIRVFKWIPSAAVAGAGLSHFAVTTLTQTS